MTEIREYYDGFSFDVTTRQHNQFNFCRENPDLNLSIFYDHAFKTHPCNSQMYFCRRLTGRIVLSVPAVSSGRPPRKAGLSQRAVEFMIGHGCKRVMGRSSAGALPLARVQRIETFPGSRRQRYGHEPVPRKRIPPSGTRCPMIVAGDLTSLFKGWNAPSQVVFVVDKKHNAIQKI